MHSPTFRHAAPVPMASRPNHFIFLVVLACAGSVTDDLEASEHLTNGEESNHLCYNNTGSGELLSVHVTELADGLERV